jgi:hypothetical protein
MLHSHLIDDGFKQLFADPCVYTRHTNDEMTVVVVWVDDIIIATNHNSTLKGVKESLKRKFKMTDLGQIAWFLGIQFICEGDAIKMNQSMYIDKILSIFGMQDCKPRSTPCEIGLNKVKDDDNSELADDRLYREIVGSLINVMTGTRPDFCNIVTKLSQHMAKPTVAHFTMAKHVIRYLKSTVDHNLIFRKSDNDLSLVGFCDGVVLAMIAAVSLDMVSNSLLMDH